MNQSDELFAFLCNEYINNGYLYSGSWPSNSLREKGFTREDIEALLEKGRIQKRNCESLAYELTVPERNRLLSKNALCSRWLEKAGETLLEEIQAEVRNVSLVAPCTRDETMITVDTMKFQDDEKKPDKIDVQCPFVVGQVVHLKYDLPRNHSYAVDYAGYRPPEQRKAIGPFMVTDVLCNMLVNPPMNMIGVQSLDDTFNRLYPQDRHMLLFEDVIIRRSQKSKSALDLTIQRAVATRDSQIDDESSKDNNDKEI